MASTNPVVRGKRVTFTGRFFGDSMLESVLQIVTLFIGWLIWFAIVAPGGQTPAKQLLNVYIIDHKSGRLASTRQVWMREIGDKYVAVLLLGIGLGLLVSPDLGYSILQLYALTSGAWILFNADRRALWDLFPGTAVIYAPAGLETATAATPATPVLDVAARLRQLESLREDGLITDVEYLQKRRQIQSDSNWS